MEPRLRPQVFRKVPQEDVLELPASSTDQMIVPQSLAIGAVVRFACNKGFSVMQGNVTRRRPPVRTPPVSAAVRFPYTRLSNAVL